MAATMTRRPFAEISSSRLHNLSSQKNAQNAVTDGLSIPKSDFKPALSKSVLNSSFSQPQKRSYSLISVDDNDSDGENVDPLLAASKKSKGNDGLTSKPPSTSIFSLDVTKNGNANPFSKAASQPSMPERAHGGSAISVDTVKASSSPITPSIAPAGRSPKHKRVGILSNKRLSSGMKRINPPGFGLNSTMGGGMPFSINAALKNSVTPRRPSAVVAPALEPTYHKSCNFKIYEDSPSEIATTRMEHSANFLDISDDERPRDASEDRGKENIPPPDYVQGNATMQEERIPAFKRRSAPATAMVDDEGERSPLGDLDAKDFFAPGLDENSVEAVQPEDEKDAENEVGADVGKEKQNEEVNEEDKENS